MKYWTWQTFLRNGCRVRWIRTTSKEFRHCFMVVDGTWIRWNTPKIKEKSEQSEHDPKKTQTVLSVSNDHCFLRFTRCDLHRLPGKGQNGGRAAWFYIWNKLLPKLVKIWEVVSNNSSRFGGDLTKFLKPKRHITHIQIVAWKLELWISPYYYFYLFFFNKKAFIVLCHYLTF